MLLKLFMDWLVLGKTTKDIWKVISTLHLSGTREWELTQAIIFHKKEHKQKKKEW